MNRFLGASTTILLACASLASLGIGVAFSSGAFPILDASEDARNISRVMAGAFGAFAIAQALQLLTITRTQVSSSKALELLSDRLDETNAKISPEADAVLKTRDALPRWGNAIREGQVLKMTGLSLRTFTAENLVSVRAMLKAGGEAQFLLLQPESDSSRITAANFLGEKDPSVYNAQIRTSLTKLQQLQEAHPNSVGLRTLDHIPASSMTIIESRSGDRAIFVEFYTEEESSVGRPHLVLSPLTSPLWFEYFETQFKILWERGTDWKPE